MTQAEITAKALRKLGINSMEDLKNAIKKLEPIDIGIMTTPISYPKAEKETA